MILLTHVFRTLLPTRPVIPASARRSDEASYPAAVPSTVGAVRQYPLIGVVTPVRNRRDWTIGFARMLCEQDYPLFKFYVVDSHSTDGTPEALSGLGLSPIVVLDAPDRAYWTEATNIGVRRALDDGCEYVLTINDDAIIPDDYLTTLVGVVAKAGAMICGSVISYVDAPGRLWGVGAYNNWSSGAFLQLSMANIWDDALPSEAVNTDALLPVDYLCGNGTLIHRSVFDTVGLYNAKYTPHYHADSEFTMRVERAGIPRWVATSARLYNRFSEISDGTFAARNQRLFSMRSANYALPVIYVLDRYCPDELKAISLVRYSVTRLHQGSWRQWSRLLRIVSFLTVPFDRRTVTYKLFFPPTKEAACIAADLDILFALPDREFAVMLYAYLLRRAGSDQENASWLRAVVGGIPREQLVAAVVSTSEFSNRPGARRDFVMALLRLREHPGSPVGGGELSECERWVLESCLKRNRPPSSDVSSRWVISDIDPSAHAAQTRNVARTSPQTGKTTVFMNVDVLCMAVVDAKAATGVHRYVVSILAALAAHSAIDLCVFNAPELAAPAAHLRNLNGVLSDVRFAPEGVRQASGVVFYPYFAYSGKDVRFADLPQVTTLCDLFPLTHPEWFSTVAVSSFRRQLHDLVDTDHVICISAATQTQLNAVLPGMKGSSSVAHLGVERPSKIAKHAAPVRPGFLGGFSRRRYFLSVGTIEPRKNLTTVIKALGLLTNPVVRGLQMLVVGQEGWNVTTQDLSAMAGGQSDRIHFLGRVPEQELWSLYRDATCTVFPSRAEGFGFPVIESMSCGTPVVTSNVSSMCEIARKGAILVDPLDPAAIAKAIESIATNKTLRKRLSQEAVENANIFTWKACADMHVKEFQRLSECRPSRKLARQLDES